MLGEIVWKSSSTNQLSHHDAYHCQVDERFHAGAQSLSQYPSSSRNAALSRSKVPSMRHLQKHQQTVFQGDLRPCAVASKGTTALQDVEDGVKDFASAEGPRASPLVGSCNVGLAASSLIVRKIGRIALSHARERTSSTYPARSSKQFR